MDALEALTTARAMRRLHAATCASSPGNSQGWDFVVVRDAALRKQIGDLVRERMLPRLVAIPESAGSDSSRDRMMRGGRHLAANFGDVPVIVFVCGASIYPPRQPMDEFVPSPLYPAAQNLLVAARAVGLGTVAPD